MEGLVGFADAGYLSDPHNGRSQTEYVFMCGGTSISWRSIKQTIATTSSNHAEILAISKECVWLRNMTHHIHKICNLFSEKEAPTVIHEDNVACIIQLKDGYIKGDRVKHISPKFFFTHDLQKDGIIIVQQIRSSENLALVHKGVPYFSIQEIGTWYWIVTAERHQVMMLPSGGVNMCVYSFFLGHVFSH
jgi:hypothetical protein